MSAEMDQFIMDGGDYSWIDNILADEQSGCLGPFLCSSPEYLADTLDRELEGSSCCEIQSLGSPDSGAGSDLSSASTGSCSPESECRWSECALPSPDMSFSTGPCEKKRASGRPRRGTATNRAALAARENRLKKKSYVGTLEAKMKNLEGKNKGLVAAVQPLKEKITSLEKEVEYLRKVISNDSAIASVLKSVPAVKQINFPSSPADCERSSSSDGSRPRATSGGICLHVAGDAVSAKFCASCAVEA